MPSSKLNDRREAPGSPAGAEPSQSELPLFAQVQHSLRQGILQGRLAPGQKLPSESQLQSQFEVSRITVRQALSALQAEGLIETFNGRGSFVTQPANAPRLGMLTGFYDHMRAKGHSAEGRILSVRTVKATARLAHVLRIEAGAPLASISTVRLADGEAVVIGRLVMQPGLAQRLLAHDLETADAMAVLEAQLGYRLDSTHIEASAVAAGVERGRALGVAPAAPLLRMSFVPHDIEDRPLLFAEMFFRPDRFSYKAVIRR